MTLLAFCCFEKSYAIGVGGGGGGGVVSNWGEVAISRGQSGSSSGGCLKTGLTGHGSEKGQG